ncbi:FAD-dependent oxidoreductase domain-containing protein 1, partial [Frankliniella fusca]
MMLRVFIQTYQKNTASLSSSIRYVSTGIRNSSNQDVSEPKDVVYPDVRLPPRVLQLGVPDESPFVRVKKVMKLDYDRFCANLQGKPPPRFPAQSDILVIGGGIVGSSIAYHLSDKTGPGLNVTVIERNLPKKKSVGGIVDLYQQVLSQPNFEMTQYAAEFYRSLGLPQDDPDLPSLPDINFNVNSSLLISSNNDAGAIQDLSDMYRNLKWNHQISTPAILQQRFPWLNCDGINVGCLGLHKEGFFDEVSALSTIRAKAEKNGTTFLQGNVIGFDFVDISCFATNSMIRTLTPRKAVVQTPNEDVLRCTFGYIIIAAGVKINEVVNLLNIDEHIEELPILPQKLTSFEVECTSGPGLEMPLIMDSSGLRVRRNGLLGTYTVWNEKDLIDYESYEEPKVDDNYFTEKLYPQLIHRIPSFKDCKVLSSKARIVDTNLWDNHLLVGPTPRYNNVLIAGGFCNNDYLFAPAVGRGIAELCLENGFDEIDLSCFRLERI